MGIALTKVVKVPPIMGTILPSEMLPHRGPLSRHREFLPGICGCPGLSRWHREFAVRTFRFEGVAFSAAITTGVDFGFAPLPKRTFSSADTLDSKFSS